jgi:glycine oxidase
MLAPGGEAGPESPWARRMVESAAMYPAFVEELQDATGLTIEFQVCGAYEYGLDAEDWARVLARAEKQRALGIESSVEGERLYFPKDGQVKSSDVVHALVEASGKLGVEFLEHTPVLSIEATGVVTDKGLMEAGTIVVAAGAWAGQLGDDLPRTFPVKGHLIGYQMARSLPHIERRGHHYVLQRRCGFTIAGSTSETVGFDRTIDLEQVARLHEETKRMIPGLPDEWESAWIGFRPAVDGEPRVERWRDSNVWLAYGHFRNGILLAPLTAKMIADGIYSVRR